MQTVRKQNTAHNKNSQNKTWCTKKAQSTQKSALTTTATTTTTVLRPFLRDYPGELVPEETLTYPPSWSPSNLYQLLPSTTIHSILLVQIACLAIFLHYLSPHPLWSTSWPGALHLIIHTLLHPISVFFSQQMPYHRNLFCCSINIISSIPSLSQLLTWNSIFNYQHLCHIHHTAILQPSALDSDVLHLWQPWFYSYLLSYLYSPRYPPIH